MTPTGTLYTTGEAARTLKLNVERLRDLIRRGKIAEPDRIGGRRIWTKEQIDAARVAIARN